MELFITLRDPTRRTELFGAGDRYLKRLRDAFEVRVEARQERVRLRGDANAVSQAAAVIEHLQQQLRKRPYIDDEHYDQALAEIVARDRDRSPTALASFSRSAPIEGRTPGQKRYIEAMLQHDLVFCLGPAGTGKTYLAVAVAVHLLKQGKIKRIALVRPAVEAGESLGYLPGDFQQKVDPYLRPLYDAMHDMMTYDQLKKFMVSDVVEVVPLAYMRGRTLNHACIILDEAQNATPSQMLMFLTRLGNHSRMIVTGDDSQVDLAPGQPSGLTDAVRKLEGTDGISVHRLEAVDIVRHALVQRIVRRYGAHSGASSATQQHSPALETRAADIHAADPQAPDTPAAPLPSYGDPTWEADGENNDDADKNAD